MKRARIPDYVLEFLALDVFRVLITSEDDRRFYRATLFEIGGFHAERNRIDQAIDALEGSPSRPRRGRPPKVQSMQAASGKRTMSLAARKRI